MNSATFPTASRSAYLAGGYWESHANFLREARTNWFWPFFSSR